MLWFLFYFPLIKWYINSDNMRKTRWDKIHVQFLTEFKMQELSPQKYSSCQVQMRKKPQVKCFLEYVIFSILTVWRAGCLLEDLSKSLLVQSPWSKEDSFLTKTKGFTAEIEAIKGVLFLFMLTHHGPKFGINYNIQKKRVVLKVVGFLPLLVNTNLNKIYMYLW